MVLLLPSIYEEIAKNTYVVRDNKFPKIPFLKLEVGLSLEAPVGDLEYEKQVGMKILLNGSCRFYFFIVRYIWL